MEPSQSPWEENIKQSFPFHRTNWPFTFYRSSSASSAGSASTWQVNNGWSLSRSFLYAAQQANFTGPDRAIPRRGGGGGGETLFPRQAAFSPFGNQSYGEKHSLKKQPLNVALKPLLGEWNVFKKKQKKKTSSLWTKWLSRTRQDKFTWKKKILPKHRRRPHTGVIACLIFLSPHKYRKRAQTEPSGGSGNYKTKRSRLKKTLLGALVWEQCPQILSCSFTGCLLSEKLYRFRRFTTYLQNVKEFL